MHRWWGPYTAPGAVAMLVISGLGWVERYAIHAWTSSNPAAVPAALTALPLLAGVLAGGLRLEFGLAARAWRRRTEAWVGLAGLAQPPRWLVWLRQRPDILAWVCRPLFRSAWGQGLANQWRTAGFGLPPSRFILVLLVAGTAGWIVGERIAGPVLATALAAAAPLLPLRLVSARAEANLRVFDEQIPIALDTLASGMAAGLSFQQAVGFSAGESSPPISAVLERMDVRLRLGGSVEHALGVLTESHPGEMLALAAEGIQLQRRYGGDLVRMLGEAADLLRMRLELDREVRAVSSQARLSGAVVAGLVPVSAGLLLTTNPNYIDVLFDTLPGQILLVVALLLQLTGWAVLGRLVRISY